MKAVLYFNLLIAFFTANAQPTEFNTNFNPQTITYNGSDKPGECWESVDDGILILHENHTYFFLLPARQFELLKSQLVNQEVLVEVSYFDQSAKGSGAAGSVYKITWNGDVLFQISEK